MEAKNAMVFTPWRGTPQKITVFMPLMNLSPDERSIQPKSVDYVICVHSHETGGRGTPTMITSHNRYPSTPVAKA
ncbi:hypothetical protein K5Z09_004821 [Escherichia coli]|nr:hypothetical protein [Escherichia coli]EHR9096849.1 hypothetical protein [Escherichia coli]EIM2919105.1 hypothetical protein [Escherichia coli]EIM2934332.1 hypothetical protein [Escherichia coli]EIM2938970.1 hypothetical protein [Escherichia coli]